MTFQKSYDMVKKKGGRVMQISERIELLIFDKGFTSIRSFANYMKEKMPYDYVSEDTISNLVKGKDARNLTIQAIAQGLDLPMEVLLEDKIILVDEYLKNEVRARKEEYEKGIIGSDDIYFNELRTVKYLFGLSRRFYPAEISRILGNEPNYHITTLAELSVYFPLIKMYVLSDVLSRIDGAIDGYETYILKQYEWLYNEIPDIPARRYADNCVKSLRLKVKNTLDESEKQSQKQLEQYWLSDEYESDYEQYHNIVQRHYDLHHNDIMRGIMEINFSEVYKKEIEWRKEYCNI